jgi:hypothetical protein
VRHEHDREALGVELGQQRHDGVCHLGVEVSSRLVGPDEARRACEGACDGDALLLAARELRRPAVEPVAEADALQRLLRAPPGFALGDPDQKQRQLDVLGRREDRDEVEGLEDEAHLGGAVAGSLGVRELVDRLAVDDYAAAIDLVEAGEAIQKRRLARAGGSHHGDELAVRHLQVEPVQGDDVVGAGAVHLADALGDEDRGLVHHAPPVSSLSWVSAAVVSLQSGGATICAAGFPYR